MESLEVQHWPSDLLDEAVILLDNIVEIFNLQNLDLSIVFCEFQQDVRLLQGGEIGAAFVDHNLFWSAV